MAPTRPVLRYHGGKWLLAPWIIGHFPPHRVYVEPFGGAASVLLRKPRAYAEVYNDLDGEVVNLFRVLRDPIHAQHLEAAVRLTPYATDELRAAYESHPCPIEGARRLLVRSWQGFGCDGVAGAATSLRADTQRPGGISAHNWVSYPEQLQAFTSRFAGVVIDNRPACDVVGFNDSAETLFYVDPPYPHGVRGGNHHYRHEMSDDDHRAIAAVLRGVAGMVVLSGYPCALYDEELFPDWHRVERRALADGARERTEVLWLNAACWAALKRQKAQPTLLEVPA